MSSKATEQAFGCRSLWGCSYSNHHTCSPSLHSSALLTSCTCSFWGPASAGTGHRFATYTPKNKHKVLQKRKQVLLGWKWVYPCLKASSEMGWGSCRLDVNSLVPSSWSLRWRLGSIGYRIWNSLSTLALFEEQERWGWPTVRVVVGLWRGCKTPGCVCVCVCCEPWLR